MNFFEQILEYFKRPVEETKDRAPEGVCPVCWGYQEYDRKIRTILEDEALDVIHRKKKYVYIRKFLKEHIDGIRLKKPEIHICPKCGTEHDKKD